MLMFYGRFKDRNKTGMRLVFLGWRLGRRPFEYGGCPVLLGGGLGGVLPSGEFVLSCRNSQSFHLETLKSSTQLLKHIDGIVRFCRLGSFGLCSCGCSPERHLRLRAGSPCECVGGATVRQ